MKGRTFLCSAFFCIWSLCFYLKSIMSWMCSMPMMLLELGVSVTAREVILFMSISSSAWVTIASWWMCLNEWVIISAAVRFFRFS